jgi:hypothetical protein
MIRFLCPGRPLLGCLSLLALPVCAWAAQPDPLDAAAAVPALEYRSALGAYRGFTEEPLQDWRGANDRVGRIGGWRSYALEAWEEPGAADDASPANEQQPNPHAGHGR